jgi:hypothetical protein
LCGENGKLRLQLLAVTLRALRFLIAEDKSFELVMAVLTHILKNRH